MKGNEGSEGVKGNEGSEGVKGNEGNESKGKEGSEWKWGGREGGMRGILGE